LPTPWRPWRATTHGAGHPVTYHGQRDRPPDRDAWRMGIPQGAPPAHWRSTEHEPADRHAAGHLVPGDHRQTDRPTAAQRPELHRGRGCVGGRAIERRC